ncbi:hypothetical protein CCMSSC00406_0006457 [Pleurotus cornucopiae]|uniref:Uncharacterized protein n=1 Tax=Pleurotus cornucopiae TaxID=5321 RepID=A0ACB7J9H7_PLECO|nr:hypothetical protein CCMSSC00406_0006457 [Pleurotus cornucopiae]
MRSFTNLAALALLPAAAYAATFDVVVGGPGILKYNPEFVTAAQGDVVRFIFKQKNHTATQSTFANPCQPAQGGFDSGFVPVADSVVDGFPVAELTVQNTDPTWVYCKQGNHCQQGMVFAVNPGDRFSAFQSAATGGAASTPPTSSSAAPSGFVTVTATVTVPAPSASASSTSTSTTNDHRVIVGGPGRLFYEPANITAQVGDTVTFEFRQKNHTVTASSFAQPCSPLSQTTTTGEVGFDSGFIPVADNATTFSTWTIRVNDTKPIWAYCRQGNHCTQGMVFSVNAVESGPNNFAAFQAKAKGQTAAGNGAISLGSNNVRGAGIATALVALIAGVLL